MDFKIANAGTGWDLVIEDGDLVMLEEDSEEDIAQRVTYALMVWLGESVYDREAGVPYLDAVFGDHPLPGVTALLSQRILETEGVVDFDEPPTFDLEDRVLSIRFVIVTVNGLLREFGLEVATP